MEAAAPPSPTQETQACATLPHGWHTYRVADGVAAARKRLGQGGKS